MSTRTHITATLFAVGAYLALTVTVAHAQRAGGMASCRTDLATFCQGIEAGGGKKMKCLAENQAKLSAECAAVVQQRTDKRADRQADRVVEKTEPALPATAAQPVGKAAGKAVGRMAACRADLATLCANVQPGGGARIKCLKDNAAKVSPTCADAMAARDQRTSETKGALKSACRDDSARLCKGAAKSKGGEGRLACLKQNTAQLSPACASLVTALPQRAAPGTPKQ
jgi:hypothetical protein